MNGEQPITSKYIKDLEAKGILEGIGKNTIQNNQLFQGGKRYNSFCLCYANH